MLLTRKKAGIAPCDLTSKPSSLIKYLRVVLRFSFWNQSRAILYSIMVFVKPNNAPKIDHNNTLLCCVPPVSSSDVSKPFLITLRLLLLTSLQPALQLLYD